MEKRLFESGHDQEEEDYVELTSSFLKKIKLKEAIDILIRHHKHVNENNTIWVHDVLTDYIELFDIDELRQSEIIETILIDINFLKERGGRAEVVVTSYQELEECISKLSIKVKKDKENIRTLLSKVSKDLDKNNTGSLDIFKEDTFNLLLNKNQKEIILLEKDFKGIY